MNPFDSPTEVEDRQTRERAVRLARERGVRLPTFAELADPARAPRSIRDTLAAIDPDAPHAANLYRVNWFNAIDRRGAASVPVHVEVPSALSGVPARIVVVLGAPFPMIGAHKVLAAYACLAPRLASGRFDPTRQRAVWPSTGNYCRGGVAISRILGCRGVAVLPAGMSAERFEWLERWVASPEDIVRTPGTESNVKEIYDRCAELARDPANEIVNQFSEFGNYLGHWRCTGPALGRVFEALARTRPAARLAGFVAASGSSGTLGAGDYLKAKYGARIAAVEAVECPTLLNNGYGEHNIQGIGDKHIPYIHNVMGTDVVTAVSDRSTDEIGVLFNTPAGRAELVRRAVPDDVVRGLPHLGLSSICNLVASIKVAKRFRLGADDLIVTVATDGAALYGSEREKTIARSWPDGFDDRAAAAVFAEHVLAASDDHLLECSVRDRDRIFNLGYFTWVEQQGVSLEDFEARRQPGFWTALEALVPKWDALIEDFNQRTGVLASW